MKITTRREKIYACVESFFQYDCLNYYPKKLALLKKTHASSQTHTHIFVYIKAEEGQIYIEIH